MKRHQNWLGSTGILLFFVGCGIGGPLREDIPARGYTLAPLPSLWRSIKPEGGIDSAFENSKTSSMIAVHSLCDRYADSSLDSLNRQLLSPFSEIQVAQQEKKMLDGRESLWTHFKGSVDGVAVDSSFVVYRKNNCIFDFLLSSQKSLSDQDLQDFTKFVNGFRYSGTGGQPK